MYEVDKHTYIINQYPELYSDFWTVVKKPHNTRIARCFSKEDAILIANALNNINIFNRMHMLLKPLFSFFK